MDGPASCSTGSGCDRGLMREAATPAPLRAFRCNAGLFQCIDDLVRCFVERSRCLRLSRCKNFQQLVTSGLDEVGMLFILCSCVLPLSTRSCSHSRGDGATSNLFEGVTLKNGLSDIAQLSITETRKRFSPT